MRSSAGTRGSLLCSYLTLLLLPLVGLVSCTTTGQRYSEITTERTEYSDPDPETGDQAVVAEESTHRIEITDKSKAPPFGSRVGTNHDTIIDQQSPEAYWIQMGGASDLRGGDVSELVSEIGIVAGEVTRLIDRLNPATALLEPLIGLEPLTGGLPW